MNTLLFRLSRGAGGAGLLALVALLCALPATSAGAAELNVSGTWKSVYHCEAGWCAGQDFPAEGALVQAPGSNHVQSGPDSGTLNGNVLTLEGSSSGYSYKESVTISADGQSWVGPLSDSNGTSGTDTAVRVSGGSEEGSKKEESGKKEEPRKKEEKKEEPAPVKGAHPTGMTVSCNYDELTSQDTCTATVADTYVSPTAPSGTVTFASSGGGLFAFGKSCSLASRASAPSTAFCSVQYLPPSGGGFPSIAASYGGDASHAPSAGKTQFILPGGTPTSYDTSSPVNGGYPNEVLVEVQTPVRGTEVRAGVTKGETGSVPVKTPRASEDPNIVPSMRTEVEERDREQRYPDIVPSMRKEVEEREIQYETDVARMHMEVNEAKRRPGGLTPSSQAEENALVTSDVTVLEQIKQQENSPALKGDPASLATLAKMTKQAQEITKSIAEVLQLEREQTGRAAGAIGSSVGPQTAAIAKVRPSRLVTVGYVRRVSASATIKLRIPISSATLSRLTHGRRSITLNLRVSMVLPSSLLRGGIPLSTVRRVTLTKAPARTHKKR